MSESTQNDSINAKRAISPYGVNFEDELEYRKKLQQKYKEDLDYLCNLRKSRGVNSATDIHHLKKIQAMNDRYNYDKMYQISLLKEYNQYNQREADNKRQEIEEQKRKLVDEYQKDMTLFKSQSEIQKRYERDRRDKLRQDSQNDLNNYYRRKDKERLDKLNEYSTNEQLLKEETDRLYYSSEQYRSKINSMNNRIFNNARKYNDYLYGGINSDLYKATNDFEFNRRIAEIRNKEKREQMYNSERYKNLREEEAKKNKEYNLFITQQKMDNQKSYKDFLDMQKEDKRMEKDNYKKTVLTESAEQLIMPSYKYPNLPQPLNRKAFDPIDYMVRTPKVKNYYQEKNNIVSYLGDSVLRHNPITFPVDDVEYNKYITTDINQQ